MEFKQSESYLMKYLDRFYKENKGIIEEKIIPIVEENSKISLRFIENFVTKYCKNKSVFIKTKKGYISIYDNYQNQLDSYDKKKFDPFKRKHSKQLTSKEQSEDSHLIFYPFSDNQYILTSIGQLNFFRWLIERKILDYIEKNYDTIKAEMAEMNFNPKNKRSKKKKTSKEIPVKDFTFRNTKKPDDIDLFKRQTANRSQH